VKIALKNTGLSKYDSQDDIEIIIKNSNKDIIYSININKEEVTDQIKILNIKPNLDHDQFIIIADLIFTINSDNILKLKRDQLLVEIEFRNKANKLSQHHKDLQFNNPKLNLTYYHFFTNMKKNPSYYINTNPTVNDKTSIVAKYYMYLVYFGIIVLILTMLYIIFWMWRMYRKSSAQIDAEFTDVKSMDVDKSEITDSNMVI